MTAYSFDDWNGIGRERRRAMPGVAVTLGSGLQPPEEGGLYWSGKTRAQSLIGHAERVLSGEDEHAASTYWSNLRRMAAEASTSPVERERAQERYRIRVEAAMAIEPELGDGGTDAMVDAQIAHYNWRGARIEAMGGGGEGIALGRLAEQSARWIPVADRDNEAATILTQEAPASKVEDAERKLIASLRAVGDLVPDPSMSIYDGRRMVRERTAEEMVQAGTAQRRRAITGAIASFTPEPELIMGNVENFAVRAATREEAQATELMLKWARATEQRPTVEAVQAWFSGVRVDGLANDPFAPNRAPALAIVVSDGQGDQQMLEFALSDPDIIKQHNRIIVAGPEKMLDALLASGYSVSLGEVDPVNGRQITIAEQLVAGERGDVLFLPVESDTEATHRSNLAQAVVSRASEVVVIATDANFARLEPKVSEDARIAALAERRQDDKDLLEWSVKDRTIFVVNRRKAEIAAERQRESAKVTKLATPAIGWTPFVAQATHLADRARNLNLAIVETDNVVAGRPLRQVAQHARDVDLAADPDRYWGANLFRPVGGLRSVAVDGSRVYRNDDELTARLEAVPSHIAVLSTNHQASAKGHDHNITSAILATLSNRPVLYADVTRRTTTAIEKIEGKSNDYNRDSLVRVLDVRLFDGPRGDPGRQELPWGTEPGQPSAGVLFGGNAPIILFAADADPIPGGNRGLLRASDGRVLRESDAARLVQEAVIERAASVAVFDDFGSDWHSANMTAVAHRMGKPGVVIDADGHEMSVTDGHAASRDRAWKPGFQADQLVNSVRDQPLGGELGTYILMRLPGKNQGVEESYSKAAFAGEKTPTLGDLLDGRVPDDWVALSPIARETLEDPRKLARVAELAMADYAVVRQRGGMLVRPTDNDHPFSREGRPNQMAMTVATTSPDGYVQPTGRLIALIAEQHSAIENDRRSTLKFESETLDMKPVDRLLESINAAGDSVAISLAPGWSARVLERALETDIPIVLVQDRADRAYTSELAELGARAIDRNNTILVQPPLMGPVFIPPSLKAIADADNAILAAKSALAEEMTEGGASLTQMQIDRELARIEHDLTPKPERRDFSDRKFQLEALAAVADAGVVIAAGPQSPDLATAVALIRAGKPVAVTPLGEGDEKSRLSFGATELARGAGRIEFQDVSRSGGGLVSGGVWATIVDKSKEGLVKRDGVWSSNAGQFETVGEDDPSQFSRLSGGEFRTRSARFAGAAPVIGSDADYAQFAARIDTMSPTLNPLGLGEEMLKPGWIQRDEELAALNAKLSGFIRDVTYVEENGGFRKIETVSPELEEMAARAEGNQAFTREVMRDAQGKGSRDPLEAEARSGWHQGLSVRPQQEEMGQAMGM